MKKWILSTVAAGALAVGGAASAQDLGSVINSVIGSVFGTQQSNYGTNTYYTDQYGRQVYIDQYGRHVVVTQYPSTTYPSATYPATVYGAVTTDAWGRPVYTQPYSYGQQYPQDRAYGYGSYGTYAYGGSTWDRDGDGISNSRDRWPDDRRYY